MNKTMSLSFGLVALALSGLLQVAQAAPTTERNQPPVSDKIYGCGECYNCEADVENCIPMWWSPYG